MRLFLFAATLALAASGCDSAGLDSSPTSPGPTPGGTGTTPGGTGSTPEPTTTRTFLDVSPTATYLRTDEETLADAAARLSDFGLKAGDTACFTATGDFYTSEGVSAAATDDPLVTAAFSASADLSATSERSRIKDVLDAGTDVVTQPMYTSGAATDVDEDFDATRACVTVPEGATHVFVGAFDNFHQDNTDARSGGQAFGVAIARQ